jgi:Holliday junction resolvasome RuvABC DNA-binding subunit
MTETLTKIIVDCSTGEQTIVPLTAEELQQREADAIAYAEQQAIQEAEAQAKAEAKAAGIATLVALGLTEAQISAITGN